MFGRRMGDLIGLRDLARRVLQSQNEGWPEPDRNNARRELNLAYEPFTSAYGPINKTTFGETGDGTTISADAEPGEVPAEDPDASAGHVVGGLRRGHRAGDESRHHAARRGGQEAADHARHHRRGGAAGFTEPARRGGPAVHLRAVRQARKIPSKSSPSWATLFTSIPRARNGRPRMPTCPATSARSSPRPSEPERLTAPTPRPCGRSSRKTFYRATSTPTSVRRGYRKPTSGTSPPTCSGWNLTRSTSLT